MWLLGRRPIFRRTVTFIWPIPASTERQALDAGRYQRDRTPAHRWSDTGLPTPTRSIRVLLRIHGALTTRLLHTRILSKREPVHPRLPETSGLLCSKGAVLSDFPAMHETRSDPRALA